MHSQLMRISRRRAQRGLTLVEVLVAIVVLAIGLLGLAGLQVNALKVNQGSTYRWRASQLAIDLADQLRANRTPQLVGLPTGASPCTINASGVIGGSSCPTGYLATAVALPSWAQAQLATLPGAIVSFAPIATDAWEIDVTWDDSRAAQAGTPSNAAAAAGTQPKVCGASNITSTGCFSMFTNI